MHPTHTIPTQESRPLVSVCVPVYNGARYLRDAIESVLAQGMKDFELLVRDDGSTDGSREILESFRDARMKVAHNGRNLGPQGNWNAVLQDARGKYVKLFHQDDLLEAGCLEREVAALESNPGVVLTFSARKILRPDGKVLFTPRTPWKAGVVTREQIVRACLLSGTNRVGEPSAVTFRREAAERVGGFDGSIPYVIDLDYWMRLLKHGPACCIPEPMASFRISTRQWSAAIRRDQYRQFRLWMDKIRSEAAGSIPRHVYAAGCVAARWKGLTRLLFYKMLERRFPQ